MLLLNPILINHKTFNRSAQIRLFHNQPHKIIRKSELENAYATAKEIAENIHEYIKDDIRNLLYNYKLEYFETRCNYMIKIIENIIYTLFRHVRIKIENKKEFLEQKRYLENVIYDLINLSGAISLTFYDLELLLDNNKKERNSIKDILENVYILISKLIHQILRMAVFSGICLSAGIEDTCDIISGDWQEVRTRTPMMDTAATKTMLKSKINKQSNRAY